MMKMISKSRLIAIVLAAAMLLTLASLNLSAAQAADYTSNGATSFTFSNSGITVTEGNYSGYKIEDTALTINGAGTYLVSGSCTDGSITVKKGTTGVTLVLNGLTLTSGDTAPISCNKSTGVTIVAAAGKINTLTDSAKNNDENYADNENAENAVIKCKDGSNVTICGSGTLNITANGKNGIKSGAATDDEGAASLTIQDVKLNIAAPVNDAINAEQLLNIESGTLNISAADDAIHSDYELNIGADGTIGPTITITDCYEAIEAATLNICSGNIDITSTDDCLNAANSDLTNYAFSMTISGGTINAYSSSGDGFDSNGSLTISGGAVVVWTANTADNQPLDADGTITISGGTVLAAGGSAGMGTNLNASQPCVIFGTNGGMGGGMNRGPQGSASASVSKGSNLSVRNTSGSIMYSAAAPCNVNYVLFSSAELTSGSSYTLYSGNTSAATATAQTGNSGSNGGMTPGASGPAAGKGNRAAPTPPDGDSNTNPPAPDRNQVSGRPGAAGDENFNGTSEIGTNQSKYFSDVTSNDYFYDSVLWAVDEGITVGTGAATFSPGAGCTRAQIVTFLWRAAGSPEPTGMSAFDDVAADAYYAKAVAWAVENGITSGVENGKFDPDTTCTRAQAVTFLYRAAGSPAVSGSATFEDVPTSGYYTAAVKWAEQNGITGGIGNSLFGSNNQCTRAQIVTFLHRWLVK